MTPSDLEMIALSSRRNNALDGITGLLLSDGIDIVQVVEGVPEAIEDLVGRLCSDPRHQDLEVVYDRPAERRAFPDWNMRLDLRPPGGVTPQLFAEMIPASERKELLDALFAVFA